MIDNAKRKQWYGGNTTWYGDIQSRTAPEISRISNLNQNHPPPKKKIKIKKTN